MTYSFSYLEPVCCSMSSSICCFLTCIQVSQEAGQVVWYSHLLQNFPQFIVIHTVKAFGVINKAYHVHMCRKRKRTLLVFLLMFSSEVKFTFSAKERSKGGELIQV